MNGILQPDGKRCYTGPECKLHGAHNQKVLSGKKKPSYLDETPTADSVFTMEPKKVDFDKTSLLRARHLIRQLSMKDMDSSLLANTILTDVAKMKHVDYEKVSSAIEVASYLHRNDTRANRKGLPRTPYIEHPLRNTLRIMRYECTDQNVIVASILHDTVEDHPHEIAAEFAEQPVEDEAEARETALNFISETYGDNVAHIVYKVSNPILPEGLSKEEKREKYIEHVDSVIGDGSVALVKFSDFVDNAVGLYHNLVVDENNPKVNNKGMVSHLSKKYLPLIPIWRERLERERTNRTIPVTDKGLEEMFRHLEHGERELTKLSQLA